jgi:hypothetical protein
MKKETAPTRQARQCLISSQQDEACEDERSIQHADEVPIRFASRDGNAEAANAKTP